MNEIYKDFFICELNEPDNPGSLFVASPYMKPSGPTFRSSHWYVDIDKETWREDKEKALVQIKDMIDQYLIKVKDYKDFEGFLTVRIPFKERANNFAEAIIFVKKDIEDHLYKKVELESYEEKTDI